MTRPQPSPYADAVPCPKCGAKIGASCTFKHWDTKQPIATGYHSERIAALDAAQP
jgi:hypothetical protein